LSHFSIFVSTASIGSLACLVHIPRPGPCSMHQWSPPGAKAALYCLNLDRNTAPTGLFARADDPRAHPCYTHKHTFVPIAHSCQTYIHNQTTGVTCRMQARLKLCGVLACLASMALGNAPCLDPHGSSLTYATNANREGTIGINRDMLI